MPSANKPATQGQNVSKFNNVFDENDEVDDFGLQNGNSGTGTGKLPPKSVIR